VLVRLGHVASFIVDGGSQQLMNGLWEIIADNLSKAGWSWGCVSGVHSCWRTIYIADAHIAATESVSLCERMKS
jgi:hypothetical protein